MADMKKISKHNVEGLKKDLEEYYRDNSRGRLNTREVMEEWLITKLGELEARIDMIQFGPNQPRH